MTTTITVSLPDEQVAAATRAVDGGRADSVSAYVSAALAASAKADQGKPEQRRGEPLADILAGWDAEAGPPSPEDDAWARRALGLGSPVSPSTPER